MVSSAVKCWKEQAKLSIKNGFKLISLIYSDKRPLRSGKWEAQLLLSEEIDKLPACGFGLVCGIGVHPLYAFDVDSKDKETADNFISAFEVLHGKPQVRVGQEPKILIPFRMVKAGIKKKKSPERQEGHVEILGGGQYFVAYNIHPKTKKEYTWTTPPHEFKAEDLPLLSEEDVEHLFEFFKDSTTPIVKEKKESQSPKEENNKGNRRYTNREITAFLSCFGEDFDNGTHDEWIPVVMAVHHETRGSDKGREIARRWSKQGATYDEENLNSKWDTFDFEENGDEHKKRSTFASLFAHHRKLIPDGLLCDRFTDAYASTLFSICNRGRYLYVESLGGWFVRKKHLWNPPNEETKESMLGVVARFLIGCEQDATDLEEWSEAKKIKEKQIAKSTGMPAKRSPRDVFKGSFKSEKASNIAKARNTVTALEAGRTFRITADKIGCDERYLGDSDGIIDLETGKQVPYSPDLIITKSTGTPFVEGEASQEFMSLVSGYFESSEVMDFFTRCVGMALLGNNKAQILVNLLGVGGSGKSTLMRLLQYAFGMQYISHLQFKDVMSAYEGDAGTPSPSIIEAFGSRIAVINETNEYAPLNEAIVKAITGGDTIAARLLYSNKMIRKRASFTAFIVTNKPLFIKSIDDSIWRRIVIIPFNKKIAKVDPSLERKLQEYALDAKRWFLQGVRDYIQRGYRIDAPEECLKVIKEERYTLDTIQRWIDDCCEVGEYFYEKTANLAESYNNYLREEEKSRHTSHTQTVTKKLTQKGFKTERINESTKSKRTKCTIIRGLRLKPAFEAIEDESSNVIDFKGKSD